MGKRKKSQNQKTALNIRPDQKRLIETIGILERQTKTHVIQHIIDEFQRGMTPEYKVKIDALLNLQKVDDFIPKSM